MVLGRPGAVYVVVKPAPPINKEATSQFQAVSQECHVSLLESRIDYYASTKQDIYCEQRLR
jgi:hypothetical protein